MERWNVIERDGFDDDAYARSVEAVPLLDELAVELGRAHKHGEAFVQDLHAALLRANPVLRAPEEVGESVKAHREILDEAMQTSEYAKWHAETQYDYVKSALGALELGKLLRQKLPEDKDERRRLLRSMFRRARQETNEQVEAYEILASTHAGEGGLSDLADMLKVTKALSRSKKCQEIMKIAGRLRTIALAKHRARVRHGPDEIMDVECGNDLARVLPSESVLLADPVLRNEFFRKFAEGELLQYRIEGSEPLGRGPIVVMVDTSGSMDGAQTGREFWAKAVALGLMAIAIEEERPFALILFSGAGQLKKIEFDKRPSLDLLIKFLEFSFDGGTCFETPLREGLAILEGAKKAADLILITDGEGNLSDAFRQEFLLKKRAKRARLFSILIGFTSHVLKPISEAVERIDDLADDEAVTDLVFGGL